MPKLIRMKAEKFEETHPGVIYASVLILIVIAVIVVALVHPMGSDKLSKFECKAQRIEGVTYDNLPAECRH